MKNALTFTLALSLALPAAAQLLPPGTLLLQSYSVDEQRQARYSINALPPGGSLTQLQYIGGSDGWGETYVAPAADRIFTLSPGIISITTDRWRSPAELRAFYDPRNHKPYAMVPMRSGHLLVAELAHESREGRVVELNSNGAIVGITPLPFSDSQGQGPYFIEMELLADQCTLVYSGRTRLDDAHHIRRVDICTKQEGRELAAIPFSFSADVYNIRQLPGGDFLIGGETEVRRYTRDGILVAVYPFSGRYFSLTPDASGFWFANVDHSSDPYVRARIGRVDFSNPYAVAYEPNLGVVHGVNGFTVIGEWRASTGQLPAAPKSRSTRR